MIKEKVNLILFLIGTTIQLTGFVVYFRDIINNPTYILLILSMGYGLTTYYCLFLMLKKEDKISSIIDTSNNQVKMKQYSYTSKQRTFALSALLLITILVGGFGFTLINNTKNPIAESPLSQIKEINERTAYFDFVRINKVNWTGGGAFAEIGDKGYPLAYIEDTAHLEEMSRFWGTGCALKFEAEPRSDIERVTIDDVKVFVSNYKPLPKYQSMLPAPFQDENILYIEIDNPANSRTNSFSAIKRINKGKIEDIGVMYLEKSKPETFVIRINAKKPGIYTIECQMLVRYKNQSQVVTLNNPAEWLFDKLQRQN